MLNAPLRIMIVAALCVLGLIGLVVREGYERSAPTSRDVRLQMQAVDPRALLQGHYVIVSLQTQIFVPADAAPCADFASVAENESWVALAYSGPQHVAPPEGAGPRPYAPVGVASTRGAAQAISARAGGSGTAVRGTAFCTEVSEEAAPTGPARAAMVQTQLAGVQRFYTSQAEAERIDALMRTQAGDDQATVFAIVNIGRDGRARLKGLSVNDEIIELRWL